MSPAIAFFRSVVLGTFVLMLVVLVSLLVMGSRPGARDVHGTIVIRRAPEQVWPWLVEPSRLPRWVGGLAEVRQDSATASGVGDRQTWMLAGADTSQHAAVVGTVTRNEPPFARDVHARLAGVFTVDLSYRLASDPHGTRLEQTSRLRYGPWVARLLQPLMTGAARHQLEADLARLDSLVEAEPAPGETSASAR